MEENEVKTKKCSRCGIEKPLSEFHKKARSNDGFQEICKGCMKEYNSKRYFERKESTLNKVFHNPDLAKFQPRELIAELRARGYRGELSYTQCIQV